MEILCRWPEIGEDGGLCTLTDLLIFHFKPAFYKEKKSIDKVFEIGGRRVGNIDKRFGLSAKG